MVKKLYISFLFLVGLLFLTSSAFALDVKVEAQTDQEGIWENQPIKGLITITHDVSDKVDVNSFQMENHPLKADLIEDVRISPSNPLEVSYYRFTIPGRPKGLQVLPSISVKVGNQVYKSVEGTYEVRKLSAPPAAAATPSGKKFLKLETILEETSNIFPGIRFKMGYRYLFNDSIELTKELLPLLVGKGLVKIGSQEINDKVEGNVSVREITQMFQAQKPGKFQFDGAHIEGYVYRNDPFGSHLYQQPMLQADTVPIEITIKPFPAQGMPASFNGAIGPFKGFSDTLKTSSEVHIGDKMTLSIEISGQEPMDNVPLPDLCCQPGWSGIFQLGDLPPLEEVKGPTKRFSVEIFPLTASVTAIPPIEFSFFIPDSQTYGTLKSQSIPITVTPLPVPKEAEAAPAASSTEKSIGQPAAAEKPVPKEEKEISNAPKLIEIHRNEPLSVSDLQPLFFGSWWVLWIIPVSIGTILVEIFFYRYLQTHPHKARAKNSTDFFEEAMNTPMSSPTFYQLLNKSLILRLAEKKAIPRGVESPEDLPETGISGETRKFLLDIEEKRFSGRSQELNQNLIAAAKNLFRKI